MHSNPSIKGPGADVGAPRLERVKTAMDSDLYQSLIQEILEDLDRAMDTPARTASAMRDREAPSC